MSEPARIARMEQLLEQIARDSDPERLTRIEAALIRIERQGTARKRKTGKRTATIAQRSTSQPKYVATPLDVARIEQRLRRAGRL